MRIAAPALVLLVAIVSALVFTDYGITWDENVQSTYGELVLDYFASGGADRRCNDYLDLHYYGPLFESLAALVYRAAGAWKYEIRHAAIGVTALLTLVAVWRYGRRCGSAAVAFFALLSLVTMPRFVGHAFNNSKDVPFACGFAWGMLGIARLLSHGAWRWRDVLLCGAGIGVALSLRVGAVLLFGLLAAGIVLSLLLRDDERRAWRERAGGRTIRLLVLVTLAWSVMVLTWPWAHGSPLLRPVAAMAEMSAFSAHYTMLFAGELVPSDRLPASYLPTYLAIVTPPATLLLAALGVVFAARAAIAGRDDTRSVPLLLVCLWCLVPVAYVVLARPNVYDGIRHFLFVLPAMALLSGVGADHVLRRWRGAWRPPAAAALVVLLLLPLWEIALLHPYQSSYFNALAGGVGGAWRRYDTDYWGSSYREAIRWVLRDAAASAGPDLVVAVACNSNNRPCAEYYVRSADTAPPRATVECVWERDDRVPPEARYCITMLRFGKAAAFCTDWPVVHTVGRRGAVFSVVRRNPDAGLPPPRP
jgi:hypothetical protein